MSILNLPKPKAVSYQKFTIEDWRSYPKENFHKVISIWCDRHKFVQYVEAGKKIPAKLPYRKNGEDIEVAEDFLELAKRHKFRWSRIKG